MDICGVVSIDLWAHRMGFIFSVMGCLWTFISHRDQSLEVGCRLWVGNQSLHSKCVPSMTGGCEWTQVDVAPNPSPPKQNPEVHLPTYSLNPNNSPAHMITLLDTTLPFHPGTPPAHPTVNPMTLPSRPLTTTWNAKTPPAHLNYLK